MKAVTQRWILVTNSKNAYFFKSLTGKKCEAVLVEKLDFKQQIEPEKPGKTFDSIGEGRHNLEPHTDLKDIERQYFAHQVSSFLEKALNERLFTDLTIVSSPKMLGVLMNNLSKNLSKKVSSHITKNITNMSIHDIKDYLYNSISI